MTAYNIASLTDKLDLPEEVTVRGAAEILGVSNRTVKRYIDDGLLPARNVAPPRSSQAMYRIRLADVIDLRKSYGPQEKPKRQSPSQRRKD